MAASWRQTPPKKVGFHGNSWWKRPRSITLCVSICRNWNSRTRQKNRCISKNRYRPPIRTRLTPAGQQLNYGGHNARNRTHVYIGTRKRCGACAQKAQCTSSPLKYLAIHIHEPARQRARDLANTPGFANAQRQRKKVEALFAELKNQIGLRRLRLRRLKFVREQFFLAAAAQNIKRLVRFLSQAPQSILPATT